MTATLDVGDTPVIPIAAILTTILGVQLHITYAVNTTIFSKVPTIKSLCHILVSLY
jgi:hypothetical protein